MWGGEFLCEKCYVIWKRGSFVQPVLFFSRDRYNNDADEGGEKSQWMSLMTVALIVVHSTTYPTNTRSNYLIFWLRMDQNLSRRPVDSLWTRKCIQNFFEKNEFRQITNIFIIYIWQPLIYVWIVKLQCPYSMWTRYNHTKNEALNVFRNLTMAATINVNIFSAQMHSTYWTEHLQWE